MAVIVSRKAHSNALFDGGITAFGQAFQFCAAICTRNGPTKLEMEIEVKQNFNTWFSPTVNPTGFCTTIAAVMSVSDYSVYYICTAWRSPCLFNTPHL